MHKKKLLLLAPVFFLTSCGGYSLNYLVKGNTYNSGVFKENYYTHWDDEFKNLTPNKHNVDTLFSFADLFKLDAKVFDKYQSSSDYANDYKMNNIDEMFNYGVQSKLFDGQMVCGAQNGRPELAYQLARVQTSESGFSIRFSKESDELTYFAMQFKASTDNTVKEVYKVNSDQLAKNDTDMYHNSYVHMMLSLYVKSDTGIVNHEFDFDVNIDNNHTNNGGYYTFIAFDLKEYNLSRLVGLSLTYTVEDELVSWNKTKGIDIDYALFLYEMFLPYTTWH